VEIHDGWSGWKGCCRHCNRGVSVAGPLNERGFCEFCMKKGYDTLLQEGGKSCIKEANP